MDENQTVRVSALRMDTAVKIPSGKWLYGNHDQTLYMGVMGHFTVFMKPTCRSASSIRGMETSSAAGMLLSP